MTLDVQTLALTGVLLLGAGYVLLAGLSCVPALRATTREAWPILLSETLIGGVVVGSIWIGGTVLWLALLALIWRCMYEASIVAQLRFPSLVIPPGIVGGGVAAVAFLASFLPIGLVCASVAVFLAASIVLLYNNAFNDKPNVLFCLELAVFPALPLIAFAAAGLQGGYGAWLLVAFILVETFDSYALLGGKLFGRTKAFPVLSPRKTVEGLVLGAIMLMLTASLAGALLGQSAMVSATIALFIGVLSVAGDLAASALKRRSGVKDYPTVLPNQGGLLDITDAWIVAGAGLVALVSLTGLG